MEEHYRTSSSAYEARLKKLEAENTKLRREIDRNSATAAAMQGPLDNVFLKSFIDATPEMVTAVDGSLQLRLLNKRIIEMTGCDTSDIIGTQIDRIFADTNRTRQLKLFRDFIVNPSPMTFDHSFNLQLVGSNGDSLPVEATLCPWHGPTEMLVFIFFRDISAQLRRYDELKNALTDASSKNKIKSEFLAAASHDIRQPLQTLRLIQGVLAKKVENEDATVLVNDLEITLASMSETLDTLLDIDQLERGGISPIISEVPIQIILNRCAREFARHARIKGLGLRVVGSLAIVRTDQRLLARILQNIVSNALKYTDTGNVLIGCRRRGNNVLVEVWDSGIGIPEHEMSRIFDRYYVGEAGQNRWGRGIGLGLAVVNNLTKLLDSELSVKSVFGKGTVFRIALPFVGNEGNSEVENPSNLSDKGDDCSILIVGNDHMEMNTLRQLLELEDYSVHVSNNSKDMIKKAREISWPDIVIADDLLSNGDKGVNLIRNLYFESGRHTNGIVLAGNIQAAGLAKIQAAGIDCIRKPAPPDELLALIAEKLQTDDPNIVSMPQPGGSVYIIERDDTQRQLLSSILESRGYRCKSYKNSGSFLEEAKYAEAGCIILGHTLPGLSSLELLHDLSQENCQIPVILLAGRDDLRTVTDGIKEGAFDIIEKPIYTTAVIDIVERAMQFSSSANDSNREMNEYVERFNSLTARECQVLRHIIAGLSNKQCAYHLDISERTIEGHRSRVMHKLGANSLAELVRMATLLNIQPTG